MAEFRDVSPITMDILERAKRAVGSHDPEPMPLYLVGKEVGPRLTRRVVVETRPGLVYEFRARTDLEGKGRISMFETDPDRKRSKRQKVAEVLTHSHQNVDDLMARLVALVKKEVTVTEVDPRHLKRPDMPVMREVPPVIAQEYPPLERPAARSIERALKDSVHLAKVRKEPPEVIERYEKALAEWQARRVPQVVPLEERARQEEAEIEARRREIEAPRQPERPAATITPHMVYDPRTRQMVWYPHPPEAVEARKGRRK